MEEKQGKTGSTDVVPWEDNDDLPAMIEPTAELVEAAYTAIIDGELPPEVGDPAVTTRLILERIRQGSLDDSLNPAAKLPNWADNYEGVPVVVCGFHLNPSTIENDDGARGVYAAVEIIDPSNGELHTVSMGGKNVLMQLVKAWEENRYPFKAQITSVRTSTPGRKTYWLRSPDEAAGQ